MFISGLEFAVGLVAGVTLLLGVAALGIIGAELIDRWRKKQRSLQQKAKSLVPHCVMPPDRERAVLCFRFRSDDWLSKSSKTEYMQ